MHDDEAVKLYRRPLYLALTMTISVPGQTGKEMMDDVESTGLIFGTYFSQRL